MLAAAMPDGSTPARHVLVRLTHSLAADEEIHCVWLVAS